MTRRILALLLALMAPLALAQKISADPTAAALAGGEYLAGVQSAANVKILPSQILTYTLANFTSVNNQTGTTYTYVSGDRGKLVTHSNASSIAGTLPQATGSFASGWFTWVQNRGAGTLTITPTTSTIDGGATLVLASGSGAYIVSDGTNYFTQKGSGSGSFTGGTLSSALNEAPTVTIASSSTPAIGAAAGNTILITGTTTITGFDTIAAGAVRRVRFAGALTLTYNASSLILPTSASITTAADDTAEFLSLGAGNWFCLRYDRKNGQALAASGSSLVNFTESVNTSSPNATIPVAQLLATNAATNVDIALATKGTGSLLASAPDSTATGGNKRGTNAVDWQQIRCAAADVASGNHSGVLSGECNRATGLDSVATGGSSNQATGGSSAAIGGSSNVASNTGAIALGGSSITASGAAAGGGGNTNTFSGTNAFGWGTGLTVSGSNAFAYGGTNTANSDYSSATGFKSSTRGLLAARAHAGSTHSAAGDVQELKMSLRSATTDATPTVLTVDAAAASATNQYALVVSQSATVRGIVTARNGSGDTKSWEFVCSIRKGANNAATALVTACTPSVVANDAGASTWALALTADTTNGALAVTFTGQAATNIRTGAVLTAMEVTF